MKVPVRFLALLWILGTIFSIIASEGCETGENECADKSGCYPDDWKCDTIADCDDSSDEQNCDAKPEPTTAKPNPTTETTEKVTCSSTEFQCKSGDQCVLAEYKCDDYEDCVDKSDESDCEAKPEPTTAKPNPTTAKPEPTTAKPNPTTAKPNPTPKPTDCKIDDSKKCDGYADCTDGSDENAAMCKSFTCPSGKSKCNNGVTCISDSARCDGYADCPAKDDEENCATVTCSSSQFKCPNSYCLPATVKCNGIPQCPNGEDEQGCSSCSGDTRERCADGSLCIDKVDKCDGVKDCTDGSDEQSCPSRRMMLRKLESLLKRLRSDKTESNRGAVARRESNAMNNGMDRLRDSWIKRNGMRGVGQLYRNTLRRTARGRGMTSSNAEMQRSNFHYRGQTIQQRHRY